MEFDSTEELIQAQIDNNTIILYMKGTPEEPMCGFSSKAVFELMQCGEEFAYVNILEHPEIRSTLPKMMDWPTFPQLYLNGELVGGCDIICELAESGELKEMVKKAVATPTTP